MRLTAKLAVFILCLGNATAAEAGPGNGIRFGGSEGRLHPFLELEGRYDSNVYVSAANTQYGDVILHVRPGLKLDVPGEMTALNLSGKLDFAQYLGAEFADTKDLSKLYAEAQLGVTVNRAGVVALEVDDLFRRSDRPQALSVGSGVVSNYNALSVRVPWRPGGGALTLAVAGTWALETYEKFFSGLVCADPADPLCNTDRLSKLGYNDLSASGEVRWRFLPRTTALFEAEYFKRLPNDTTVAPAGFGKPAGYRVMTGLTGLITTHVAATLEAGYGGTSGVTPSLGTWLATADLEWLPTEAASVALGYSHDFRVDPVSLYDLHRVSLEAKQLLAGRYTLRASAALARLGYETGSGNSLIFTGSPGLEVEVTRWLKTELAYAYTSRTSSSGVGTPLATPDYEKHEVWLKATCTY